MQCTYADFSAYGFCSERANYVLYRAGGEGRFLHTRVKNATISQTRLKAMAGNGQHTTSIGACLQLIMMGINKKACRRRRRRHALRRPHSFTHTMTRRGLWNSESLGILGPVFGTAPV